MNEQPNGWSQESPAPSEQTYGDRGGNETPAPPATDNGSNDNGGGDSDSPAPSDQES